jgi:DNA repair protein RecN (Recombination protein N)
VQRDLLDHFGGLLEQREATDAAYSQWSVLTEQRAQLIAADANRESRLDLLEFQLNELEVLALSVEEYEELLAERQKCLHGGRLAEGIGQALGALADDEAGNAGTLLAEANKAVAALLRYDSGLLPVQQLLESAAIQVSEAADTLQHYGASLNLDPARRDWIEERLDAVQSIARKHRIEAEEIPALHERLRLELDELTHAAERGQQLDAAVRSARNNFQILAEALSVSRAKAATRFSDAVTAAMSGLGMPGGKFDVRLTRLDIDDARPWGLDEVEFLISANPGQAPQALARVASGGELSRMSLAIQVIASDGSSIPTMVFDEVDSGVGGSVAEMVGRRLQELGARRQVLCVTHLPQVASLADAHFRISKVTDGKATRTGLRALGDEERIQEIARMLGGVEITPKTIDHAAEMLAGARRKMA